MLDANILSEVKASLEGGETKEQIYQKLLSQGKTVQETADYLDVAQSEGKKIETEKRSISAVVMFGTILVIAGIISFLSTNWDVFGKALRVAVLTIFMILSYGVGYYVREIKKSYKAGSALLIFGSIVYGASIFLIAETFKVKASFIDGFVLWILGTMIFAFLVEYSAMLYLSGFIALCVALFAPFEIVGKVSGHSPQMFVTCLLLILITLSFLITARHFRKKVPLEQTEIY